MQIKQIYWHVLFCVNSDTAWCACVFFHIFRKCYRNVFIVLLHEVHLELALEDVPQFVSCKLNIGNYYGNPPINSQYQCSQKCFWNIGPKFLLNPILKYLVKHRTNPEIVLNDQWMTLFREHCIWQIWVLCHYQNTHKFNSATFKNQSGSSQIDRIPLKCFSLSRELIVQLQST